MTGTDIRAVVCDMDGVLWCGDEPLPGLTAFFEHLHRRGLPYVLATNNSSRSPTDYVQKLASMGVTGVPPESIMTSGTATAAYLQARHPAGTRVHVLGGDGLRQALAQAGFALADDDVALVVVGLDRALSYEKLWRASSLIRDGALFVGTNADTTFPMPQGPAPGAGSIIAALAAATGQQPLIVGKPHPPMFQAALDWLGQEAAHTLMIGDRLDTDIVGAARVGLQTALVLTGIAGADDLAASPVQPDMIFSGLPEVIEALMAS
jgi:4-nitrophenyl phosphatase